MKDHRTTKYILFQGSPQGVLILKLIVALIILAVSRILLYFMSSSLFPHQSFWTLTRYFWFGLRFDISAILYANLPFIVLLLVPFRFRHHKGFQKFSGVLFIVTNAILLVPNLVDSIYFRFTMKRLTGDIFKYLTVGMDSNIFSQFIRDFWFLFIIWFLFIFLLIWVNRRILVTSQAPIQGKPWYYGGQILLAVLLSGAAVVGMRGGLQLKPVSLLTAAEYADAQDVPLVLNSAFTIMKTLDQKGLDKKAYYSNEAELKKVFNAEHTYASFDSLGSPEGMNKMNIVVIILESFSREHIGALNKNIDGGRYKGFTPFLDSLIGHCSSFEGFANGKRSIEGIPAILGGLPTWMDQDFITSLYSANKINSLASLLKPQGYTSSFFHGGTNGTMGFNNYTKSAGFDRYYGRQEYNNEADYDGKWGIWDEPFLQYFARELDKMPQPFISSVFTLSSHHPYKIPEPYKGKFRKGALPIQESIMYADFALGKFFATARHMKWFDNTLFVITADHTSEAHLDQYKTRVGQYRIPILFYLPNNKLITSGNELMQQTDIMPTILDFLNFPNPFVAFGSSVLRKDEPRFCMSKVSNSFQIIQGDLAVTWDGNEINSVFDIVKDPFSLHDLTGKLRQGTTGTLQLVKAVVQQYNNRMIENRLTCK